MRIVAGRFRSVALSSVGKGDPGAHLRPTADRVRESLFNVLNHLGVIEDARVLDVFAGTGALGLEALSRGAAHVSFVEDGRVAQLLIQQNVSKLKVQQEITLIRRDALRLPANDAAPYDLVFLDPPYGKGLGQKAIAVLVAGGWLAPGATVVWEENAPMQPPTGFEILDRRVYGDTHVTLLSAETP